MYLIVGLGNPEKEYENTRHNMGFNVINELSKICEIDIIRNKFEGLYGNALIHGKKAILLKPQTYMNLSGKSIKNYINFFKIDIKNLIVIYDDMDIEKGIIKIRKMGGPGTHNGMKSVVDELDTQNFIRVRVGIGKPKEKENIINYVIGHIDESELKELETGINTAKKAVLEIIENGIDKAMNKYN